MLMPARFILLGWVAAGIGVYGEAPVTISSRFHFGFEPASFMVRVEVPRHADNRSMCVGYDGSQYSNSCWLIDGDSPAIVQRLFKELPAGDYVAFAVVRRTGDQEFSSTVPFEVLSRR